MSTARDLEVGPTKPFYGGSLRHFPSMLTTEQQMIYTGNERFYTPVSRNCRLDRLIQYCSVGKYEILANLLLVVCSLPPLVAGYRDSW